MLPVGVLLSAVLLGGCSDGTAGIGTAPSGSLSGPPSGSPPASAEPATDASATAGSRTPAAPGTTPAAKPSNSTGWTVTVYYTAVASLHTGTAEKVTGCPKLDCTKGHDDLGSYPSDFVQAVKDEGAGRISTGKYLNWSYDTGYWLDTAARDTAGRQLVPFSSAAADRDVLKAGTRFSITQCGTDDGGATIAAAVCAKLKDARWTITDEFTPGLGGSHHVDAYIGEETSKDFTNSDWYTTLHKATLSINR